MSASPITESLADYFNEHPASYSANPATMLRQAEAAQAWLLCTYLGSWLKLLASMPAAGYPIAKEHVLRLERLGGELPELDKPRNVPDMLFYLAALEGVLRGLCASVNEPEEIPMQWAIWARDVPMAIAHGFSESELLDPVIVEGIAPCCMYAALLTGMIVTDDGVFEEIEQRMFEELPRELIELVRNIPDAAEA